MQTRQKHTETKPFMSICYKAKIHILFIQRGWSKAKKQSKVVTVTDS